jgi:hypothetical protein
MTENRPMMVGAATVFIVSEIAKSIGHYRDALGFAVTFQRKQRWGQSSRVCSPF